MGLFKKEQGIDVLDLTLLYKKGLLKLLPPPASTTDIIDFTALTSPPSLPAPLGAPSPPSPPSSPQPFGLPPSDLNPFAMLDALSSTTSPTTNVAALPSTVDAAELNALKIKLEDLTFKLERLVEKVAKLDTLLEQR